MTVQIKEATQKRFRHRQKYPEKEAEFIKRGWRQHPIQKRSTPQPEAPHV